MNAPRPTPLALSQLTDPERLARIRLLATDVDGTLTTDGVITAEVITMITRLVDAGIEVTPVSGRSAGEVLGLVRYLPGIRHGIAENGQVLVAPDQAVRRLRSQQPRHELEQVAREIAAELDMSLELAPDSFCRVGDIAFERAGRSDAEIDHLRRAAEARNLHCVWSNVHVHFSNEAPDKGVALLALLPEWEIDPSEVVTLGDAPNDAGLFDATRFGTTVGTADVLETLEVLPCLPERVTREREGAAFLELGERLLSRRCADLDR